MAAETKKIALASSDGEKFIIEEAVASQSKLLANMMEDGCTEGEIPIANVAGKHLAKVIEYAKRHAKSDHEDGRNKLGEEGGNDEELKAWDNEFAKSMDQPMLYHLILASNYLDMQPLLGLMCQTVADMIKGKKPEEIRQIFNIKNDFTPQEEEEIRRENQWAFDS